MRRRAVVLLIVALTAALYLGSHVERFEDSFLFVTTGSVYDPLGSLIDLTNRLTRDCSAVTEVEPGTPEWLAVTEALSRLTEPDSSEATPLRARRQGDWFMVEAEFASLEPAIVLLSGAPDALKVHPEATWSGTTAPRTPGPLIREHMIHSTQAAPASLIRCFDPTLPHFAASLGPSDPSPPT